MAGLTQAELHRWTIEWQMEAKPRVPGLESTRHPFFMMSVDRILGWKLYDGHSRDFVHHHIDAGVDFNAELRRRGFSHAGHRWGPVPRRFGWTYLILRATEQRRRLAQPAHPI